LLSALNSDDVLHGEAEKDNLILFLRHSLFRTLFKKLASLSRDRCCPMFFWSSVVTMGVSEEFFGGGLGGKLSCGSGRRGEHCNKENSSIPLSTPLVRAIEVPNYEWA